MTALLEMKQNIKNFYGRYETYLMPAMKFVIAMIYFLWVNSALGFSEQLKSIFVVLILALLCSILPTNSIVLFGFVLIVGHCYALGIETAAFALVLIILMMILFLRFSPNANLALIFTPLGYMIHVPAAVPLGSGLLGGPLTAAPAACGVILRYFIKLVNDQAAVLQSEDTELPQKLKLILDSLLKNQEMWITVAAFVVVVMLVYLIRTRSLDYAWRIAIVVGAITYVVIMLAGGLFLEIKVDMVGLVITAVASVIMGIVLEFFTFGGDYTRTEHLEYEDDDYYYYVKAVPKASVGTSVRQIKKINAVPEEPTANPVVELVPEELPMMEDLPMVEDLPMIEDLPMVEDLSVSEEIIAPQEDVDFEKKLEESLKDL